ncbi:MAG TPA: GAF domain-containing sensor histidine kinase [Longimicrobium sp.]|nr:GAF domain-containing sensor histidine kinase [Longimicrobium sp.]
MDTPTAAPPVLDAAALGLEPPFAADPRADDTARLERLLRQERSLRAVIESISSELELRPLLTRIVQHACELIGADHGTIGLVDETRWIVRTEAVYHMPPDELGAETGPGEGLAGQVLLTARPLVLERYGDVAHPTQPSMLEHPVIGMPIAWRGRMVGFFGAGRSVPDAEGRLRPFTPEDVEALGMFARHAAIAIQNARRYEAGQRRSERLALIARVGQIIAADLHLDELLQRAADAIHDLLGYPNVSIPLVPPNDPTLLVLTTVGGRYREVVRGEHRMPIARGLMGAAARTREPVLVNDVSADPRYVPTPGATGITCELAVPILLGGERVLGVLNVESDTPFSNEDAFSLQIIADQLAVAIENARLYERGQRLAVLEERQRLARELHDSVTQLLFGISLIAQSLGPAYARDGDEGARRAARLLELSRGALAEMRALISELRPSDSGRERGENAPTGLARVRRDGLAAALQSWSIKATPDGVRLDLRTRRYRPQTAGAEEALFRIAQEALHNVGKHARAHRVRVRLGSRAAGAWLVVRDDGRGFDPAAPASPDGARRLGLLSMRERAEELGGALRIDSAPGRGTRVAAWIPLAPTPR